MLSTINVSEHVPDKYSSQIDRLSQISTGHPAEPGVTEWTEAAAMCTTAPSFSSHRLPLRAQWLKSVRPRPSDLTIQNILT